MSKVESTQIRKPSDKRTFPRIDCLVDLDLITTGEGHHECSAVDISLGGIGLELKEHPNPFTFQSGANVEVGLTGFPSLQASICWCHGRRVGLRFAVQLQALFESWVGEVLAAQGVLIKDVVRVY